MVHINNGLLLVGKSSQWTGSTRLPLVIWVIVVQHHITLNKMSEWITKTFPFAYVLTCTVFDYDILGVRMTRKLTHEQRTLCHICFCVYRCIVYSCLSCFAGVANPQVSVLGGHLSVTAWWGFSVCSWPRTYRAESSHPRQHGSLRQSGVHCCRQNKTNSLLTCHSVMAQYENTKPT